MPNLAQWEELLQEAAALAEQGDVGAAIESAREAVLHAPQPADALSILATLLWRAQRLEECAETCVQALRVRPLDARIQMAWGVAVLAQGKAIEAEGVLRRAISLDGNNPGAFHNLALALHRQGRIDETILSLRKAIELNPALFPSLELIASLLDTKGSAEGVTFHRKAYAASPDSAEGALENARAALVGDNDLEATTQYTDLALDRNPDFPAALTLRAMVLIRRGLLKEAEADLVRAIELNPGQSTAYYELVYARKVTPSDGPILDQLIKVAADDSAGDQDRRVANFSLGKAFDDLGRYEEAMAAYHTANALSRKLEGKTFDPAAFRLRTDQMIATFTKDLVQSSDLKVSDSEAPVFILGMYRSGTTLVEHILSSHSKVKAGEELPFWRLKGKSCFTDTGALLRSKAMRLGADYLDQIQQLAQNKFERVTDKTPDNYLYIGLLHMLFPKARFVFCKRHPVDNCLSHYFTYFMSSPAFACDPTNLVIGYREHERLLAHWQAVIPGDRLIVVRYEDLVENPEPEIHRLIAFAGLEWEEQCFHPEDNKRAVTTASRWQVRQPIYKSSRERWRNYEPYLGPFADLLEK